MKDFLLGKVRQALGRKLGRRDAVLVGVSGGPDSVALASAIVTIEGKRRRVALAHVNHHLRGTASEGDRRFVVRLARSLGVAVFVADGPVEPGANLEERAREVRYALLAAIARREGFRWVATAHTEDDQAETVLLRLLRGAGSAGLGAMAAVRGRGIIRPLLDCSRAEVMGFLARRRLRYRIDASNRSELFTRNRVRRRLLPLLARQFNPSIRAVLARTAGLLRDDEEWLDHAARLALRRVLRRDGLDGAMLSRLAPALARRVVRLWLAARRGDLRRIEATHVERLRDLARAGVEGGRASIPGATVRLDRGRLRWGAGNDEAPRTFAAALEPGRSIAAGGWQIHCRLVRRPPKPGRWRAVFDRSVLDGAVLGIRTPLPGDRLRPLGLGGSKKLQDVFVDARVPRPDRAGWAVIHSGDHVLWLPGLVRSEVAPVDAATREALVIEARWRRTLPQKTPCVTVDGTVGSSSRATRRGVPRGHKEAD